MWGGERSTSSSMSWLCMETMSPWALALELSEELHREGINLRFPFYGQGPPRNNLKVVCTRDKVVRPGAITTIRRPLLVPDHAARRYGSWALVVVIEKMSIVNMEPVRICEVPMQQRLPFPLCWNNETSLARVSLKA